MAKNATSTYAYPVLNAITEWASKLPLPAMENILFVCVQHLLKTTNDMLDHLFTLGANPQNLHILGKTYSS